MDTSCKKRKHTVAILALPGFVPFDLSIPYNIFPLVRLSNKEQPYDVILCAEDQYITSNNFKLGPCQPLKVLQQVDTVFVPGLFDPLGFKQQAVLTALQAAADNGVRVASICTGACILAAAGLLDSLKATTHWEIAKDFTKTYPQIQFEPNILFADNGQILTSAGLASGIDLCLHMIRKDYGSAVAQQAAQFFVTPMERDGNYPQQIKYTKDNDNLTSILLWLSENLHTNLTLRFVAAYAGMSPRTLNRKFQDQLGLAPMAWVTKMRIQRAQALLESTTLSIEQIVTAVGFANAAPFREQFRQKVGVSPITWRKTWNSTIKQNR